MKTIACAVLMALSGAAFAAGPAPTPVAGAKIDSGLGDLPHYRHWVDKTGKHPMGTAVLGESQDSGLGDLPHYSRWIDKSGKDPMGERRVAAAR
jgi:hypothetical protein